MSLFKKPNRKFRQRVAHADSEDEESSADAVETKDLKSVKNETDKSKTHTVSGKNVPASSGSTASFGEGNSVDKEDPQSKTARKLLSFHDEEDEQEVFKVKKSNYSRRLAKQLEKERKKRQETADQGTSTSDVVEIAPEPETSSEKPEDQQKQQKETWDVYAGKEAEDMEVDSDEGQADNPFKNVLQSGVIPDAATIYAMKKHRQKAREVGDFISLEDPEKTDENKSRLVREDDNDRSDDDDDEPSRLSFTVNTGAIERQKVREAFLSAQEGDQNDLENEEADELERWEAEQIRKGVGITQVGPQQTQQLNEQQLFTFQQPDVVENQQLYGRTIRESTTVTPDPLSIVYRKKGDSALTTSTIKARLQERLTSLNEVHRAHQLELETCRSDVVAASELIARLEKEKPDVSKKFTLYQQMRGYVRDMAECLDLKVAHIEILEDKMMNLFKSHSENLIGRRHQDVRDQADEYSILCSKVMKGSSMDLGTENCNFVDEGKARRVAEREGRRMRRRKKRDHVMSLAKHHDGMSSDDEELEIDVLKFKNKKENILCEANSIFEDVLDEFGTLDGVMYNFEAWKNEQKESYVDAYVPLCLPKIFGPFVRLEMMDWNPLEGNRDLESMHWYEALAFYGSSGYIENDMVQKDPDINLLPGVVERIVLPKITEFVKNVWDPMSTKETLNLISLMTKLHEEYPCISGKSKQMQTFLKEVSSRIYKSLNDDVFIPLYPKELLEKRSPGSSAFFQRQFWTAVKLLRNILNWDGILSNHILQNMSLACLLNRYLLMGLRTSLMMSDTLEKCQMIVSAFPKSWFANLKGSTTIPQLQQFAQFLVQFAQLYYSQCSKTLLDESETVDVIKDIIQTLVFLGALEEAVVLKKQFSSTGNKSPA